MTTTKRTLADVAYTISPDLFGCTNRYDINGVDSTCIRLLTDLSAANDYNRLIAGESDLFEDLQAAICEEYQMVEDYYDVTISAYLEDEDVDLTDSRTVCTLLAEIC